MKHNRILAMLLTAAMLFALLLPTVTAEEATDGDYTPIYTIEDLYCVRYDLSGNYKLMNDLDITADVAVNGDWDSGYGWTPIGETEDLAFTGSFDGQGHCITGLRIENNPRSAGLFGFVKGGSVQNLRLAAVEIRCAGQTVGGVAANLLNGGSISGCHVEGTFSGSTVGGIVGKLYGSSSGNPKQNTVSGCSTEAVLSGSTVGGIAGSVTRYDNTTIRTCFVMGEITATNIAGGIVGSARVELVGSILSTSLSVTVTVENCYNLATVTAKQDCGGIVGEAYSCGGNYYNNGYGSSTHTENAYITVRNTVNYGATSCENTVGAIVGYKYIKNSDYAKVTVSDNYYLKGTASTGVSGATDTPTTCVPLTAVQSRLKNLYGYLDFETTWFWDDALGIRHPQLQGNAEPIRRAEEPGSLSVETMPDSTVCIEGSLPSLAGGSLCFITEDGSEEHIPMEAAEVSFDSTRAGRHPLTLEYAGQTVTVMITVEHDNADQTVPAGCKMSGYTLHQCKACGYHTVSDFTEATGHHFGEWEEVEEGIMERSCADCGETETALKMTPQFVGDLNGDGVLSIMDVTILLLLMAK